MKKSRDVHDEREGEDYQQALATLGIQCSMSCKGTCRDNAVAERFFSRLKMQLIHDAELATREQATTALCDYIEVFYNQRCRHSSLGYLSPTQYERAVLPGTLTAEHDRPRNRGKPTISVPLPADRHAGCLR